MGSSEHYREIKERFPIVDVARELGFTVVKKGKYYSLKEHDSVMIDTEKNCYWQNSIPGSGTAVGVGGSVIDFVMSLGGYSLYDTLAFFEKKSYRVGVTRGSKMTPYGKQRTTVVSDKKTSLVLPKKAGDCKRVFAYLIKTRKINARIVQELVHRKYLYQDTHGNCVFVSYDNGPVFACLRGTNTGKPFYGDVAGCDYSKGWYLDNQAEKLYVTESVIDALSVMTIKGNASVEYNYLALGGTGKWEAVFSHLAGIKEVWVGTDNDRSGQIAANNIKNHLKPEIRYVRDLPEKKDWNRMLTEGLV